jgi:hypothetical protein
MFRRDADKILFYPNQLSFPSLFLPIASFWFEIALNRGRDHFPARHDHDICHNDAGWYSERVSAADAVVASAGFCSFCRTSWQASIFGPFLCRSESQLRAAHSDLVQEKMYG